MYCLKHFNVENILQSANTLTINGFSFDLDNFLITVPELVIQKINNNHFMGQVPPCITQTAYHFGK